MLDFEKIFNYQVEFQKMVWNKSGYYGIIDKNKKIPTDDVNVSSYHCLALSEELGEVLKSDKRWKNYRNTKYDKNNKIEEISDCLISLFNIAMHSDINALELYTAVIKKIHKNIQRIENEQTNTDNI